MSEAKAVAPTAQPQKEPARDAEWLPIHKALPLIIGAIGPISKNSENKQQGYKFRGIDDVYKVLNLLLARYGVSIRPEVLDSAMDSFQSKAGGTLFRCTMKVRYHLTAGADGSTLTCDVPGEGMDSGDKATPKALSCAYKYMAFQLFCIPTGEKIDSEEESHEVEGATNGAGKIPAEDLARIQGENFETFKKSLLATKTEPERIKVYGEIKQAHDTKQITDAHRKLLLAVANTVSAGLKPEQAKA